jgi:hypothetical protein
MPSCAESMSCRVVLHSTLGAGFESTQLGGFSFSMLYSTLSNPSDTHTLHIHPCFHPIFLGIVGFLVYIGHKCISSHHPCLPFLTLDFTGQLALKTLDEWNNIIKLALPYIVISFKVHAIVSPSV